ncbi:MAG: HesB/IscA family protein [Planctomycetota bacterium]|jgi:iron-sulfur cluster assembly protein
MPTISIDQAAADKGNALIAANATEMDNPGLRVKIVGGGCSGLMYNMDFADGPDEADEIFEVNGFKVFIDKKSLFFLNGSELVYKDGLTGAGFKFQNPNVTGTCGCGESFAV